MTAYFARPDPSAWLDNCSAVRQLFSGATADTGDIPLVAAEFFYFRRLAAILKNRPVTASWRAHE